MKSRRFTAPQSMLRWLACTALAAVTMLHAAPKKLLVVEVTTGYRHASIETAEHVLAQLAQETGEFSLDYVRQPAGAPTIVFKPGPGPSGPNDPEYQAKLKKFEADYAAYEAALKQWLPKAAEALKALSPENLAHYDGVIFDSTTGMLPLPDKAAFLQWIADGHAFIGVHSATDTFHDYPDFVAMIGGEFKTHGPQVEVECLNQDPKHPATEMLPAKWDVFDEIYQFKNHDRAAVHELLVLDKHPNDKTPGFYPLAWYKQYHKGRVFYTALGHRDDVWDPAAADRKNSPEVAKLFQQHVLGGIRWALGLAEEGAAPQTK